MKKFLSLMLVLAMVISMIIIPAANADDLPVITILMRGDNTPNAENAVLDAIGAKFGCKVIANVVSKSDYNAKVNTTIAGGSMPDILQVFDSAVLTDLAEAGKLLDMAPLLDEYGPDIKAYYGDDIYKGIVNDPDGGIYALFSEAGLYVRNLAIRKDWLAAVGKEVPTTLDELYDVMVAFTENDPDGNGKKDTRAIGLSLGNAAFWEHLFSAFNIPISGFSNAVCELEDGTVTTIMKHPNFSAAMAYIRKMYQAGLFDPDFATMTQMQTFEKLWNAEVGMLDFQAVGTTNNWYPGRYTFEVPADPNDMFVFCYPEGAGGVARYAAYDQASACAISSDCANPELAVAIVNYLYYTLEGQNLGYLGVEGLHYEWIDKEAGKYQRLGQFTDDVVHRADGAFSYVSTGGFTKTNAETRLMNKCTQDAQAAEWERVITYPRILKVLETRAEYGADLDQIFTECFAELVTTTGDADAILAEYVQRWEDEGGLEYEAEATAEWALEK